MLSVVINLVISVQKFYVLLLDYQGQNLPILFMNETNFNIHISRSASRSVRGTRCTVAAAGSKGTNIHVIGCISTLGLIQFEVKRGAFHRDDACEWLRVCFRKTYEIYRKPVVIILDNASCRSRIKEVLAEDEFRRNHALRLAPYSPMLNPIENIWSVVKADVKSNLAEHLHEMLNNEYNGQLSVREFRPQFLERFIRKGLELIALALCCSTIAHIQSKVAVALALEDISF